MICPYQSNSFCHALPDSLRESLCVRCRLRRYGKGQRLNYHYWEKLFAILLDGFMIFGDIDAGEKLSVSGLAASGNVLSPGPLINVWNMPTSNRDILCMSDCIVAILDFNTVQELFEKDITFVKAVYDNILEHCCAEKHRFLQNVGGRDSQAAVRYVIDWCQRNRIPTPTHEQIALMCNRSRSTVTETIHTLLIQEPDLFQTFSNNG